MHNDGPVPAGKFYKDMLRKGPNNTDVRDSVHAVHFASATKAVQDGNILRQWTTFVHIGI